jgi:hypothetical protein
MIALSDSMKRIEIALMVLLTACWAPISESQPLDEMCKHPVYIGHIKDFIEPPFRCGELINFQTSDSTNVEFYISSCGGSLTFVEYDNHGDTIRIGSYAANDTLIKSFHYIEKIDITHPVLVRVRAFFEPWPKGTWFYRKDISDSWHRDFYDYRWSTANADL